MTATAIHGMAAALHGKAQHSQASLLRPSYALSVEVEGVLWCRPSPPGSCGMFVQQQLQLYSSCCANDAGQHQHLTCTHDSRHLRFFASPTRLHVLQVGAQLVKTTSQTATARHITSQMAMVGQSLGTLGA